MAIIFEKKFGQTGALIDTMLILEPREALIYPFDFGDDWTEIRMGMALSIVSVTGNNEFLANSFVENLAAGNPSNNYWMGFIGWTGNIREFYGVPNANGSSNGTTFVGLTTDPYQSPSTFQVRATQAGYLLEDGAIHYEFFVGAVSTSGNFTGVFRSNTVGAAPTFPGRPGGNSYLPQNNTGFTNLNGVGMKYNPSTNRINFAFMDSTPAGITQTSDPNVLATRQMAGGTAYPNNTWISSGTPYTHDFTAGGIPLQKPKGVIIYSPFFTCKLRISSLIVERYA